MKRIARALLLLLAALLLLPSCKNAKKRTATLFCMDTVMDLTIYGSADALAEAEETLRATEKALSVTDAASEISALNQNGGGEVSPAVAALLSEVLSLCGRTGGALDPTVYPIVRAWGFTTGEHRVPAEEELAALLPSVGYAGVTVDGTRVTLLAGAQIDLGSVGKGYAADVLTAQLRAAGVTRALLNLGGNVQAIGTRPDGNPWRVAIKDPNGDGYAATVAVTDRAVVTSGGYERCFERDGIVYHHIIDPATGKPAQTGIASVTVIAKSGLLADALSTALFVMGLDRATAHWRSERDFEAIIILQNGELYLTEGLEPILTVDPAYAGKATVIRA